MRLDDIEPITSLKRDTAGVFERSRERGAPIAITSNGKVTGVVIDVEVFEQRERARTLLKLLAQSEQAIKEDRTSTHDEAIAELESRLARFSRR